VPEEFKNCSDRSRRLLEDIIALSGRGDSYVITLEWMKAAQEMVHRVSAIMSDPGFTEVRSSVQVHQYRSELIRLKGILERGQQQLISQRKTIQSEQARLKRVRELTGTIRAVQ
jgi:GMP synthase PP-ATPase subunit